MPRPLFLAAAVAVLLASPAAAQSPEAAFGILDGCRVAQTLDDGRALVLDCGTLAPAQVAAHYEEKLAEAGYQTVHATRAAGLTMILFDGHGQRGTLAVAAEDGATGVSIGFTAP
ncbi:hypothetical protein [Roseospirillum parvum]|uniref:Uncharacterized protein n=1 Tax=Roseospirillum parvum TaxID=83401 RepID=A0A1G7X1M2_9PROT|nr:hypothetical protein [Roseospirillum parvum]SDG78088.1 hypothetical protein SAMN05421742_102400 [Roseospirillum parvum]